MGGGVPIQTQYLMSIYQIIFGSQNRSEVLKHVISDNMLYLINDVFFLGKIEKTRRRRRRMTTTATRTRTRTTRTWTTRTRTTRTRTTKKKDKKE